MTIVAVVGIMLGVWASPAKANIRYFYVLGECYRATTTPDSDVEIDGPFTRAFCEREQKKSRQRLLYTTAALGVAAYVIATNGKDKSGFMGFIARAVDNEYGPGFYLDLKEFSTHQESGPRLYYRIKF